MCPQDGGAVLGLLLKGSDLPYPPPPASERRTRTIQIGASDAWDIARTVRHGPRHIVPPSTWHRAPRHRHTVAPSQCPTVALWHCRHGRRNIQSPQIGCKATPQHRHGVALSQCPTVALWHRRHGRRNIQSPQIGCKATPQHRHGVALSQCPTVALWHRRTVAPSTWPKEHSEPTGRLQKQHRNTVTAWRCRNVPPPLWHRKVAVVPARHRAGLCGHPSGTAWSGASRVGSMPARASAQVGAWWWTRSYPSIEPASCWPSVVI